METFKGHLKLYRAHLYISSETQNTSPEDAHLHLIEKRNFLSYTFTQLFYKDNFEQWYLITHANPE